MFVTIVLAFVLGLITSTTANFIEGTLTIKNFLGDLVLFAAGAAGVIYFWFHILPFLI